MHLANGTNSLHFYYDAQNRPAVVEYNWVPYAYVHNLQGDIIAIVDGNGNKVVEYKYDAWGKPISKTGSLASTLGTLNPFRYRGYVYDEETGLYYLRSRFYSFGVLRFINSDHLINTNPLVGNSFAYCSNNPVIRLDSSGRDWTADIMDAANKVISNLWNWWVDLSQRKLQADIHQAAITYEGLQKVGSLVKSVADLNLQAQEAQEQALNMMNQYAIDLVAKGFKYYADLNLQAIIAQNNQREAVGAFVREHPKFVLKMIAFSASVGSITNSCLALATLSGAELLKWGGEIIYALLDACELTQDTIEIFKEAK